MSHNKAVHSYEKHGNQRLVYRNGEPIMMAITNPNPEDKENQNIIVLQRIRELKGNDIMAALVEMLNEGR